MWKKTWCIKHIYTEEQHKKPFREIEHDTFKLYDSRKGQTSSIQEAQDELAQIINVEQSYEEYSNSARYVVTGIEFVNNSVQGSQITASNPQNMPLCQASYGEYNFTTQEKKYLINANTCVVDNLVGLYGQEQKSTEMISSH